MSELARSIFHALGTGPRRTTLAGTWPQPPYLGPADVARAVIAFAGRVLLPFEPGERETLQLALDILARDEAPAGHGNLRYSRARATRSMLAALAHDCAQRSVLNRSAVGRAAEEAARVGGTLVKRDDPTRDRAALATAVLDDIYAIEAAALIAAYDPSRRLLVDHVLYRDEGRKDRLGECIVRFSDSSYGIVAKSKGRHVYFAGSRADVLAVVHSDVEATLDFVFAREAELGVAP